jgi:Carboxypeptidase regulatory-like domain
MRILVAVMLAAVMFLGGAPASEAQQARPGPRRPVRDPRQLPATGTATIRGRVVDGITGAPIPRAKVRTSNRDRQAARAATTDTEGVFTLTRVTSGALTLMVEKSTYIVASYPERRRTMRTAILQVSDGQTIDDIVIPMFRGGAITGRVIDAYGDPLENVVMQAVPVPQNGRSASSSNLRVTRAFQGTNDIGEFRIGRLEPGQYYLMAMPARRSDSLEDSPTVPGRTWYPGVSSIEQAQPITIERGGSTAGIDFQMLETTLTKVTGVLLTSKGLPSRGGHVSARAAGASKGLARAWGGYTEGGGAGVEQNGSFELLLQPGEYILEGNATHGEEAQRQGRYEVDRGQVKLMVSGESISGVTIATGAGGAVSGRFVFKGTSAPPTNFGGFNITIAEPNGVAGEDCRSYGRTTVNPDGTFSGENIWGTCQINGNGVAKGWTFEAVMHNGNDITNGVIEFGNGRSISGVEVVYTDRVGEISATVSDERGAPTEEYVTIVFPVDKQKWGDQRFVRTQTMTPRANAPQTNAAPGYTPTRVSATTYDPSTGLVSNEPFSAGAMPIRNVLAGDYFAVAVDDVAFDDLRDPEYLERLSQMATRVSISPGETQTVQLRRVKAPE